MTLDMHNRRLRTTRAGVPGGVGIRAALGVALAVAIGLQVGGAGLQKQLGAWLGQPSVGAAVAASGGSRPSTAATVPRASAGVARSASIAAWHGGMTAL